MVDREILTAVGLFLTYNRLTTNHVLKEVASYIIPAPMLVAKQILYVALRANPLLRINGKSMSNQLHQLTA